MKQCTAFALDRSSRRRDDWHRDDHDAEALVAPAAVATAVVRLLARRLALTAVAAEVEEPRAEMVTGRLTSSRCRRCPAATGTPTVTFAVDWTDAGRPAMMAVFRAASWEALTEEEPTRVKVVDTGKSVTVTVTADADTPAADATADATLAVVKLLGLMPERDRPTVTTAADGGKGGEGGGGDTGGGEGWTGQ